MLNLYCNVTQADYVTIVRAELFKTYGSAVRDGERFIKEMVKRYGNSGWTVEQLLKMLVKNKIEVLAVDFRPFTIECEVTILDLKGLIRKEDVNIMKVDIVKEYGV